MIVAVRSAGTQKPVLYAKNLTGVDLSGIDFRGANLGASVFNHADLRGADFTGSTFRGVKGLEQAVRAAARGLPD